MNTSPKMILTVYLGLADQTLVNRHKRVYETPLKIIKWWTTFWIALLFVPCSDEQFSDNVDKQMLIQLVNENVIPFHCENTLDTKIKQN